MICTDRQRKHGATAPRCGAEAATQAMWAGKDGRRTRHYKACRLLPRRPPSGVGLYLFTLNLDIVLDVFHTVDAARDRGGLFSRRRAIHHAGQLDGAARCLNADSRK